MGDPLRCDLGKPVPAVTSMGKRHAARRLPSRMADTRVLCVSATTVYDNMLSVADDVAARPVHERARSVDTQGAARRGVLERTSGVTDGVMVIRSVGQRKMVQKKSRHRCLQRANEGSPDQDRTMARRNQ